MLVSPTLILMTLIAFLTATTFRRHSFAHAAKRQVCSTSAAPATMTSSAAHPQSYQQLTKLYRDISTLSEVLGVLEWDQNVMMSAGSAEARGKQKALLTTLAHEKLTSPTLSDAIAAGKADAADLGPYERAVVRDIEREHAKKTNVPAELESEITEHQTHALQAWVAAKNSGDLATFAPTLNKTFDLSRAKALAIQQSPGANLSSKASTMYDVNLDMYERGMTSARLTEIFEQVSGPLKRILDDTLQRRAACERKVHPAFKDPEMWPVDAQKALCEAVVRLMGYDFDTGRLDESVHPFTISASAADVRITTRYNPDLPLSGLMGCVHEAGHALYEQGRNAAHTGLPVAEPLSMGVHESQSLFWERMVAQSRPFWESILPTIYKHIPKLESAGVTADDLYFYVNQLTPENFIRVEADELAYPFHIIVRFELERDVMNDGVEDLDALAAKWNALMKKYLGLDVPNHSKGILQDIHWPMGAVGYFPSYSLGAMMAAQLFAFLKKEVMPDIEQRITKGDFESIRKWLNVNIHEIGSLYPSLDELLENVTGEPLNPQYFLDYLENKYAQVYS